MKPTVDELNKKINEIEKLISAILIPIEGLSSAHSKLKLIIESVDMDVEKYVDVKKKAKKLLEKSSLILQSVEKNISNAQARLQVVEKKQIHNDVSEGKSPRLICELPYDILNIIAKLISLRDLLSLSATSKKMRAALKKISIGEFHQLDQHFIINFNPNHKDEVTLEDMRLALHAAHDHLGKGLDHDLVKELRPDSYPDQIMFGFALILTLRLVFSILNYLSKETMFENLGATVVLGVLLGTVRYFTTALNFDMSNPVLGTTLAFFGKNKEKNYFDNLRNKLPAKLLEMNDTTKEEVQGGDSNSNLLLQKKMQ